MLSNIRFLLALIAAASCPVIAQEPHLVSGQLLRYSAADGLDKEIRRIVAAQSETAWIGYAVPMIEGEHRMCCEYSPSLRCCGICLLESGGSGTVGKKASEKVELERTGSLLVLLRAAAGQIQKIRTFSADCELDTGGLSLHWFTGVRPRESTSLLASFVRAPGEGDTHDRQLGDAALAAIAFHKDDSADEILGGFASPTQPESMRERTTMWFGIARGRRGYETLRRMMHEDPSERVRGKAVFGLSQSPEPEAVVAMIEAAKSDKSQHVRGEALFWLAQKAGRKAGEVISGAIENDPNTEVKKKAVFALSQLPADEGVPKLIQVARTNRNPEVRKQAMFWLGQSKDPRALSFLEEVLSH